MTYDEARLQMADWLDRNASTCPNSPTPGYDEMDEALPRDSDDPRCSKLFVALSFWDGWIDASNHAWQYYQPICESDWPVLARELASTLRADHDVSNPVVLKRFG